MGTESFTGVRCSRGVLLTTHPLLVPRSRKSRATPLPTLWTTPGLKRDHFTFTFTKENTRRNSLHIYICNREIYCILKTCCTMSVLKAKLKWSCYRPGVAKRVGRGIALLFHDHGTRRGWVVSSTPRPHFTPRKDPVPTSQEAGWAPGPVWTGGKSRPHRDSIPDRPAHSQSLYWLSYPAHTMSLLFSTKYHLFHNSTLLCSKLYNSSN